MHRILLVDDDRNFRRSLVIQLELEGYAICDMESGSDALDHLSHCVSTGGLPDLVITDVRMAEMRGEVFVKHLKALLPEIPVIVISAFDLPDALTGYAFLKKPFKIQEMIECIRTAGMRTASFRCNSKQNTVKPPQISSEQSRNRQSDVEENDAFAHRR